tara:strand:+ start:425 stop:1108 length:684 start_codon:yes stop_codon:yes gene_type:complete
MRQNCKAHNLVNNLLDYMYDGNNDIKLCDGKICDQIKKDTNNVEDIEFYIPEQKDTLFWCFYNAYNKDYLKDKFFTIEKEFKIGFIEIARKNKETVKLHKLKLNDIEDDLLNNQKISKKTLLILAIYYELNFIIIENHIFYKIQGNNENINHNIIVLDKSTGKYKLYIGKKDYSYDAIEAHKIDKPMKAVSGYKVEELRIFAEKLNLECKGKNKGKLYQDIIDKIYN